LSAASYGFKTVHLTLATGSTIHVGRMQDITGVVTIDTAGQGVACFKGIVCCCHALYSNVIDLSCCGHVAVVDGSVFYLPAWHV
jgi:hypothetical protein